jgi:hypothetical protein
MKILSASAVTAAGLVAAFALATAAHAAGPDPIKCQREIAKDFSKYVQAKTKALQKCNEAVAKDKIPGPCPDTPASDKIAKADSKLRAGIAKKCGGSNKSCLDGDAVPLASIGWPAACPNFEGGTCTNAISNCDDISDCLLCIGEAAVDQAISLYYDDLETGEFGTNSDLNKCQVAIGKNTAKFLQSKNKALQKCEDGILKGTVVGPCPDSLKAEPAITKAESKKIAKICKACGGPDKTCDGVDDFTPAQIGFPANCPSVTIPGGAACGGAVTTLQDLVDCVDCVSEFKADCLDPLPVPSVVAYPAECNAGGAPACASTPNDTPTPCPTATPGIMCPTQVITDADGPNLELDTGWNGQAHDAHATTNNRLTLSVSGCSNPDSSTCGVCTTSGPLENPGGASLNNHRCTDDPRFVCTVDGDCSGLRCSGGTNAGASCTVDSECPGGTCATGPGGTCSFYFGSPLPLSAGGVAVCVTNQITAPISGTVDIEAGTTANTIELLSRVHTAPDQAKPCPNCIAGTCDAGPHTGASCTVSGHSNLFGDVSFDCPPDPGSNVGNLPITLAYATGTQTRTLSAASPPCSAAGFGGFKCLCDTCNNLAQEPCASDADCPPSGGNPGICGGKRCIGGTNAGAPCSSPTECPGTFACNVPGIKTQPNNCDDSTCSPVMTCVGGCNAFLNCSGAFKCAGGGNDGALCTVDSECPGGSCDEQCPGGACVAGNEGTCAAGPFEQFCAIQTFRGCFTNADCPLTGDTCTLGKFRDCYLDNGTIGGSVSVTGVSNPSCGNSATGSIGALFCVPPTASGSVNSASGIPGLGRVLLPYTSTFN